MSESPGGAYGTESEVQVEVAVGPTGAEVREHMQLMKTLLESQKRSLPSEDSGSGPSTAGSSNKRSNRGTLSLDCHIRLSDGRHLKGTFGQCAPSPEDCPYPDSRLEDMAQALYVNKRQDALDKLAVGSSLQLGSFEPYADGRVSQIYQATALNELVNVYDPHRYAFPKYLKWTVGGTGSGKGSRTTMGGIQRNNRLCQVTKKEIGSAVRGAFIVHLARAVVAMHTVTPGEQFSVAIGLAAVALLAIYPPAPGAKQIEVDIVGIKLLQGLAKRLMGSTELLGLKDPSKNCPLSKDRFMFCVEAALAVMPGVNKYGAEPHDSKIMVGKDFLGFVHWKVKQWVDGVHGLGCSKKVSNSEEEEMVTQLAKFKRDIDWSLVTTFNVATDDTARTGLIYLTGHKLVMPTYIVNGGGGELAGAGEPEEEILDL